MTLPAELRAERDRRVPDVNAYYHDEATRALLHRAADALEWRGIESAPRDGTAILAHGPKWLASAIMQWDDLYADWYVHNSGTRFICPPTHWRPLDAPLPATPEGDNNSTNDEERV